MEKVLMLIGAFTFGCYLSHYLLKGKKKKKTKKKNLSNFLKITKKKYNLEQSGSCRKNERD